MDRDGFGPHTRGVLDRTAGCLVLIALSVGCSRASSEAAPSAGGPPVPVSVATAERADMPIEIRAVGTVEPLGSVVMKPLVTGTVQDVHFEEGAEVKAGALLARIDARPFEAALHAAEAELARDTALALDAEQAAQQTEEALEKKAVSERAASQSRAAAAAAQALVRRDEAAVETARLQIEYCSVRAPFDGRTGKLLVKPGSVVKANETDIVSLNQVAPIRVAFSVPERHLPEIRKAMAAERLPVEARVAGASSVAAGVLDFIDNTVDRATGTIGLRAIFQNEDRHLWPGQFVEASLRLAVDHGAIVVPAVAVQTGQQGDFVFVVLEDESVEMRPIVVARIQGDRAVIAEGLKEGEVVVTEGQLRLALGSRVAVKDSQAPRAPSAAGGSAR